MSPIDPSTGYGLTPDARTAERLVDLERRLRRLERGASPGTVIFAQYAANASGTATVANTGGYTDPTIAATPAPMTTWTIPSAGDYLFEVGASMTPSGAGLGIFAGLAIGGSTTDLEAALLYLGSALAPSGAEIPVSVAFTRTAAQGNAIAASTTVKPVYKSQGGTGGITRRWAKVTRLS